MPVGQSLYQSIPYVEDINDYRAGGFHPVHLGDLLDCGRYRIINKLGYGTFSTVWLAEDLIIKTCVAIAIQKAEHTLSDLGTHNITILHHLSQDNPLSPGRTRVLLPLREFRLYGPNGTHFCVVSEIQGPSLSTVTKRKLRPPSELLPLFKAKRAAHDLIMAFDFIHDQGVVHGGMMNSQPDIPLAKNYTIDLHPGNILMSLPKDDPWTAEYMESALGQPRTVPVKRVDGRPLEENVPRYGVEEALGRLSDMSTYYGAAKLSDFGCAFFANDPPEEIDYFGPYVVPEQYCTGRIGFPMDIWTLGCAIFLLLSGHDFFGIPDQSTGKTFSIMTDVLGVPPEDMFRVWNQKVNQDLQISSKPSRPLSLQIRELKDGNPDLKMKCRQHEISDDDISLLTSFLQSMVVYEPEKRLTIAEVLKHPAMAFFV